MAVVSPSRTWCLAQAMRAFLGVHYTMARQTTTRFTLTGSSLHPPICQANRRCSSETSSRARLTFLVDVTINPKRLQELFSRVPLCCARCRLLDAESRTSKSVPCLSFYGRGNMSSTAATVVQAHVYSHALSRASACSPMRVTARLKILATRPSMGRLASQPWPPKHALHIKLAELAVHSS